MRMRMVGVVGLIMAAGVAHAAAPEVAHMLKLLGSADFAQREAGQKELDTIPFDQIETLRGLAAVEADAEVKVRLEARVEWIEDHAPLNPPGLTVDFKGATLGAVIKELNRQLGGEYISPRNEAGPTFTLKAERQPFWQIVAALNEQAPIYMTTVPVYMERVPISLMVDREEKQPRPTVVESFGFMPVVSGKPGMAPWTLQVRVMADPRLRVVQTAGFRIEAITDGAGADLMRFVIPPPVEPPFGGKPELPGRNVPLWGSSAQLNAMPHVTRLKEVRGTTAITMVEHETTVRIDLTRPEEWGKGPVTVEMKGKDISVGIPPCDFPTEARARRAPVGDKGIWLGLMREAGEAKVRILDKDGKVLHQFLGMPGAHVQTGLSPLGTTVEVIYPDRVRAFIVPVVLSDVNLGG